MSRPQSVTIVAWVLIALSVEGLVVFAFGMGPRLVELFVRTSVPVGVTVWAGIGLTVLNLVLAILFLRGFGWARIVYVTLLGISVLGMLMQGQAPGLIVSAVLKLTIFSYFLFSKDANAYFAKRPVLAA